MRKILFITMLSISFSSFAQEGFEFILVDNLGRSDTVIFGNNKMNATSGIDSELGEINLYDEAMDSIEIRSIQRDSLHHECITGSYPNINAPLYFEENIDLKIDFRSAWSSENDNFEFEIHAVEYPIKLIADFSKWQPAGMWFAHLYLLKENCGIIDFKENYHSYSQDTLLIDSVGQLKGILIKMEHEVGINDKVNDISLQISPNPIKERFSLSIKNGHTDKSIITIYSSCGQVIEQKQLTKQKDNVIDISSYTSGLYFIQYKDGNGNTVINKILKE